MTGRFELLVNGATVETQNNWKQTPSRIPIRVEQGKKYKIEVRYAQMDNWQAGFPNSISAAKWTSTTRIC